MATPEHKLNSEMEAELFRLLVENVRDYAIFLLDRQGRVQSWNAGAERLLGYREDEIVGQSADRFFTPEDVLAGVPQREIREACDSGGGNDDRWHVRKDGSRFWSGGLMTALRDERGGLRGFAKIMRDRTEWKLQQEASAETVRQHRQNEARKSAMLETALDCIITMDSAGKVVEFNPAAERTFGYQRASAIGRELADLIIPPSLRERHRKGMAHYLATGEGPVLGKRIELPALHADGTQFPVELAITRIAIDGPPVFTAYLRDISERLRAEQLLRESEGRYRGLMEQAPFSVQVFAPDGRTLRVNRAWSELWGVTPDQITDYNVLEDPQLEAKGVLPYLRRAFAGEAVAIPAISYDPNATLPDRTRYDDPVRWVSAVAYPLKDAAGRVIEVVLVHEDITARMRAESGLRESEEKLRLLADTIPQLAWMAHPDGHIFWYNRRWYEYTGTTAEAMEGWGWQSVHDPQVLPEVLARWKASIAGGEPFDMVFPLKGADQQFRPFLTRVNPLRDAHGSIIYWCGTNTDISDIKRMEDALRHADRRKDEFLATLAHELRNPLAPIRNSLQILKMPRVDAATAQQTRDIMERQVHHLVRLVDDLLDVSRVMRGKIELRKEPVELATVVARGLETAQPLIEVQRHRLEISLQQESLLVDADPVRLAQVIGNLLTNAAKYTEANGHIGLSARREGSEAVLRVEDDGIGIAPDMLPHIFELFVQADHAAARSQGGLGIGLTLVKNLVELHGGTIAAQSAGLGKGCEFTIRLPLSPWKRDEPAEVGDAKGAPSASGHRLLVVDDNKDAADSLASLLRLQGHHVRVAHDGASALNVATAYRPALIFLDIGMPGMDGYEVARRMRAMPVLENTKIAALTGWGQQEDRRRSASAGFDHHLVKPPEPEALEKLLAQLDQSNG